MPHISSLTKADGNLTKVDGKVNHANDDNGIKVPSKLMEASSKEGLGIVEFLKGKNLFITGATGFLAKVLVEKILQVQPDVGQLYLLIQEKATCLPKERLQDEIIQSPLFINLKSCYGDSYQEFMQRKLTPIAGNITLNNLGMSINIMEALQRRLDIIINSAASTTFDSRYDHAFNINTRGAQRVVNFAKSCRHLKLLMHVSTTYVNRKGREMAREKTLGKGSTVFIEAALNSNKGVDHDILVEMESEIIEQALNKYQSLDSVEAPQPNTKNVEKNLQIILKELGMQRANKFGWENTYAFTKAMGEIMIDSSRGQLPVVIVRPSVVESSFKNPFPGWLQGNRMMDPLIISYGKGYIPGFLMDPKIALDVVPVDMVANAVLAAMAKHANTPKLEVYQVASSIANPCFYSVFVKTVSEYFKEHPFMDTNGKPLELPTVKVFQDVYTFMNAVSFWSQTIKKLVIPSSNADSLLKHYDQLTLQMNQQAARLASLYKPYTLYDWRFDNAKTQQLHSCLSQQEKEVFGFDVRDIDWETYIKNIHIPGLRKYVLKGGRSKL